MTDARVYAKGPMGLAADFAEARGRDGWRQGTVGKPIELVPTR
jgi:hypothetical protein